MVLRDWIKMMTPEDIKTFCKNKGITQKRLAEMIGITPSSLCISIRTNKVSPQTYKIVELLIENERLSKELAGYKELKTILKEILKGQDKEILKDMLDA